VRFAVLNWQAGNVLGELFLLHLCHFWRMARRSALCFGTGRRSLRVEPKYRGLDARRCLPTALNPPQDRALSPDYTETIKSQNSIQRMKWRT
jgi:hypothetical protein